MSDVEKDRSDRKDDDVDPAAASKELLHDKARLMRATHVVAKKKHGAARDEEKRVLLAVAKQLARELRLENAKAQHTQDDSGQSQRTDESISEENKVQIESTQSKSGDGSSEKEPQHVEKNTDSVESGHDAASKKTQVHSSAKRHSKEKQHATKKSDAAASKALEKDVSQTSVLVNKMPGGEFKEDAQHVLQHTEANIAGMQDGDLQRKEALRAMRKDGAQLLQDSQKVATTSKNPLDEAALLGMVHVLAKEHQEIEAASRKDHMHKTATAGNGDATQSENTSSHNKGSDATGTSNNVSDSSTQSARQIRTDLRDAVSEIRDDADDVRSVAEADLHDLKNIQKKLTVDMQTASDKKKTELNKVSQEVKIEIHEMQRESKFDAENQFSSDGKQAHTVKKANFKPVEKAHDKPVEKAHAKPADKAGPKPAQKANTVLVKKAKTKPVEKAKPKPVEKASARSVEKPVHNIESVSMKQRQRSSKTHMKQKKQASAPVHKATVASTVVPVASSNPKSTALPEASLEDLGSMERSADHFVDKEVKAGQATAVQAAKEIELDASHFSAEVAKSARLKVQMDELKRHDQKVAAQEAQEARSIISKTIEDGDAEQSPKAFNSFLQLGESYAETKESHNLDAHADHPLAKAHSNLDNKVKALKEVTKAVTGKLDCLTEPEAPGCKSQEPMTKVVAKVAAHAEAVSKGEKNSTQKATVVGNSTGVNATETAEQVAVKKDESIEIASKQKLNKAKAALAKEQHEKFVTKKAAAIARVNAAKETQTKKKLSLIESLKALESSEEARAEEAKAEDERALVKLKSQKQADLEDETRLNEARYVMNYVKKQKADIMKMKLVNPVAGAIEKAKRDIEMADIEHEKDKAEASKAAHAAAVAAMKFHAVKFREGVNTTNSSGSASGSALRLADLRFHQEVAVAHLSQMELLDAQGNLRKQERTFNNIEARLQDKQKKMMIAAEAKAKEEGPKMWAEKLSEMKEKVKEKNGKAAQKQAEQEQRAQEQDADTQEVAKQQDTTEAEDPDKQEAEQEAEEEDKFKAEEQAKRQAEKQAVKAEEVEADQQVSEEKASQEKEKEDALETQKKDKLKTENEETPQKMDNLDTPPGDKSPEADDSKQDSSEEPAKAKEESADAKEEASKPEDAAEKQVEQASQEAKDAGADVP